MKNIFYFRMLNAIGGIETFIYSFCEANGGTTSYSQIYCNLLDDRDFSPIESIEDFDLSDMRKT